MAEELLNLTQEQQVERVRALSAEHVIRSTGDALRSAAWLAKLADNAPPEVAAVHVEKCRNDGKQIARFACERLLAHLSENYEEAIRLHKEGLAYIEAAVAYAEAAYNGGGAS